MEYNVYELKILPKSSFMTFLESDIIWGHIIWAMNYIEGEESVLNTIKEYKSEEPPFIISNGFYSGLLPFINKKVINRSDTNLFKEILSIEGTEGDIKTINALKKIKKIKSVSLEIFEELREGNNNKNIVKECFEGKRCPKCFEKSEKIDCKINKNLNTEYKNNCKIFHNNDFVDEDLKCILEKDKNNILSNNILLDLVMKNNINRLTGTTNDESNFKGLFNQKEYYYDTKNTISIYFKIRKDFEIKKIEKYLDFIQKDGFGKRKSTGKGFFEIISFEKNDTLFKNIKNPNGYIVLSNYIPKENDFDDIISSEIMTKRGKLGGEYSFSEKPFKKPIVLYKAGSVFKGKYKEYHGKMLENIHFDKNIMQYGYSFSVGVNLDE